jgi:hypothetical protein
MDFKSFLVILVSLLSTNHKCTHPCLLLLISKRCDGVKLLKMLMLGVRSPQSIACGVGASVSRIELYNSDRFVSFVYVILHDTVTVIHFCLLYA